MLLSGNSRIDAQPQSGDWKAQTDFGELVFTVNSDGTKINKLIIDVQNWSCGNVSGSWTITVTFTDPNAGWPITNDQFNIEVNTSSETWIITGTFQSRYEASGTWSGDINGTICSGSWGPIPPVSVKDVGDGIPERFLIAQNYPNPFNPSTKIKYQIPELSFVTLKVFDFLGNEIATLVNEEKPVGSYEVNFSATALPSGVYFYRLQAGSFIETKKMVLMK